MLSKSAELTRQPASPRSRSARAQGDQLSIISQPLLDERGRDQAAPRTWLHEQQFSTCSACALLPSCRGKGMPITKAPGTFGNLIIKFDVVFPRTLSNDQKAQLRGVFAS